jgi:hypothetical protein
MLAPIDPYLGGPCPGRAVAAPISDRHAEALIDHLADGGTGSISETAVLRAFAFAEYLETHAHRAYGAGSEVGARAAKAIPKHIRKRNLSDGLTGRDVHQRVWSNLSDRAHVQAGLDLLCDRNWFFAEKRETGGRPTFAYRINPRAFQ